MACSGLQVSASSCHCEPRNYLHFVPLCHQNFPPGTVQNGSELLWGCLRMVFGHVWTSFWELFVCFIVVLNDFCGFNPPGKDLKRKDSTTQKNGCEIAAGDWPFQGFVQQQWPPSLVQCEGVGHTWHWSCQAPRTVSNAPPYLHCCTWQFSMIFAYHINWTTYWIN